MKKTTALLFAVFSAAAAFSIAAFVNNATAIAAWWKAFLAAGGDSSLVPAKASGAIPWLDWSAVDYSGVATLIPALGFTSIAVSLLMLLFSRRMRTENFPFFAGADQFNIALGLFGTLWGIITIGYFKLDTVTMADLMQCLHTALYSTLVAVVWVFMLDRPLLRPLLLKVLEKSGLAERDEGDLSAAVQELCEGLRKASEEFDARQTAYEKAFEARLAKYEREFTERQKEYVEFFRRRIAELESEAAEAKRRESASAAKLRAVAAAIA